MVHSILTCCWTVFIHFKGAEIENGYLAHYPLPAASTSLCIFHHHPAVPAENLTVPSSLQQNKDKPEVYTDNL